MPKILQDELVRGISKRWGLKELAGEAQATSASLQPSLPWLAEPLGSPKL